MNHKFIPQFRVANLTPDNGGYRTQFTGLCRVHKVKTRWIDNPEDGGQGRLNAVFRLISGTTTDGRAVKRWHYYGRQQCIVFSEQLVTDLINRCADGSVQHTDKQLAMCHAAGMVVYYPTDRSNAATRFPHVVPPTVINWASRHTTTDPTKEQLAKARAAFRAQFFADLPEGAPA